MFIFVKFVLCGLSSDGQVVNVGKTTQNLRPQIYISHAYQTNFRECFYRRKLLIEFGNLINDSTWVFLCVYVSLIVYILRDRKLKDLLCVSGCLHINGAFAVVVSVYVMKGRPICPLEAIQRQFV